MDSGACAENSGAANSLHPGQGIVIVIVIGSGASSQVVEKDLESRYAEYRAPNAVVVSV